MTDWIHAAFGDGTLALRLLLAALLGGLIGLERQTRGRSAGLRTNILVCVGSAAVIVAFEKLYAVNQFDAASAIRMDPARAAAGVITGIGFIGAGTIIKSRDYVRGLTTAASIWVVSALGVTLGLGEYGIAAVVTALVLITLFLLHRVNLPSDRYGTLTVTVPFDADPLDDARLAGFGMTPKHRDMILDRVAAQRTDRISVRYRDEHAPARALQELAADVQYLRLEWR